MIILLIESLLQQKLVTLLMQNGTIKNRKAVYIKYSSQGAGSIPIGAEGKILLYVEHPVTAKLLVDFSPYGKAIVPLSSIKIIEE